MNISNFGIFSADTPKYQQIVEKFGFTFSEHNIPIL